MSGEKTDKNMVAISEIKIDEIDEVEYSFWMVWGNTCEGNLRWHMVRTPIDWDTSQVRERAESHLSGGCGDDFIDAADIEYGYDDGLWIDYCES